MLNNFKLFAAFSIIFFTFTFKAYAVLYDQIEVSINNRIITKNEINELYGQALQSMGLNRSTKTPETQAMRQKIIDQLIDDVLLALRAEELGIKIANKVVEQDIERFKKQRHLTQINFENLLAAQKMTLAKFKEMRAKRLQQQTLIAREVRSGIKINDEILKKRYEKHGQHQLQVHARHILLQVPPNTSTAQLKKIRQEIIWIRQQILQGKSFVAMAKKYSQDPSVQSNNGDLGNFSPDDMVKEFADVVKTLKLHQISEPVKTQFGFHLIEVLERQRLPRKPFAEIKDKFYQQEYQKIFTEKIQEYIKNLRQKALIKYHLKNTAS